MSPSLRSLGNHPGATGPARRVWRKGAPDLIRGLLGRLLGRFMGGLLVTLIVSGCAVRPLSDAETAFLATTHGQELNAADMEIVKGALIGQFPMDRPPRPAVACRERIWPPETGETVTGYVAGMVLYDRLLMARWFYSKDLLKGYPMELPLSDAMFLAHEATHVWQWQQAQKTGYAPWKAAAEHSASDDPYLFNIDANADFLDYGYEQQASLVEEYVCCRALDPTGPRTDKLRNLLRPVFPDLAEAEIATRVRLPWDKANLEGICH